MLDVIIFLVFVAEYAAFFLGSGWILRKVGISRISTAPVVELVTIVSVLQIAVVLLLLGRTWNPTFIVFVLAAYQVPIVASWLIGRQIQPDSSAEILLFSLQRGARGQEVTPTYGLRGALVGWAVFVIVFIISSVAYFMNDRPSQALTTWLLAAQALAYAIYTLNGTSGAMALLASPALSDRTRLMQLIARLTAIAPLTLWLAILSSGFGWSTPTAFASIGTIDVGISPGIAIIVVAFLAATSLAPYAVGVQRRGRVRGEMLTSEQDWLTRLAGILAVPERATLIDQLNAFCDDANEAGESLFEAHPELAIDRTLEVDPGELAEAVSANLLVPVSEEEGAKTLQTYGELVPRIERRDPVFRFATRLEEMTELAAEIAGIDGRKMQTVGRNMARSVSELLRRREESIEADLKSLGGRSGATAAVGFAVTAVSGVILNQLGRWAWETFISSTST